MYLRNNLLINFINKESYVICFCVNERLVIIENINVFYLSVMFCLIGDCWVDKLSNIKLMRD